MLTVNKLEKIIELEDNLRGEYQSKLDAQAAEIERYKNELAEQKAQMQATIDGLKKEASPRSVAQRRGKKVADILPKREDAPDASAQVAEEA